MSASFQLREITEIGVSAPWFLPGQTPVRRHSPKRRFRGANSLVESSFSFFESGRRELNITVVAINDSRAVGVLVCILGYPESFKWQS